MHISHRHVIQHHPRPSKNWPLLVLFLVSHSVSNDRGLPPLFAMSYRTIEPYLGSSYRLPTKVVVPGAETGPPSFNFLSFLATVQRFRLQILPILWDAGRQDVGAGATSRVSEGTINVDTSFAYKRVNREKTEAQIFQAFSNEISVLSHPMIRRHRNVAQLQGICWEISPADNNPWPVLVFEKTHLGDLRTFMRLSAGSQLGVKGRLGLCLGIGNALRDFHNHGMKLLCVSQNVIVSGS